MAIVATGAWFGRKAYKKAAERRLLSEASQYMAKKDLRNTALCLQRALQVNPLSLGAANSMGDLLESAGVPAALGWRIRAAELNPKNVQLRFAWAETALKLRDLRSADTALAGTDEKSKSTAAYHKLLGALAWGAGHASEAETNYLEALRLEPTNQAVRLNLATIHLASTNEAIAGPARMSMEQMTANSNFKLTALHYLMADAVAHKSIAEALSYSQRIVQDPAVTLKDKIDHLQLLRESKSPEAASWLASLKTEAAQSPVAAFALGQWMATADNPTNALRWLKSLPAATQTNQPVPLIIADCHLFLKDWPGLQALVEKQDWGEANYFRFALESLARRSQGQDRASQAAWQKAVHKAGHRLDSLSRLALISARWGWSNEHTDLLRQITSEFPRERWATDQLIAELYGSGNSRELAEFVAKVYASDPTNPRLKNNLAAISMLRKSSLDQAYRLAREAYDSAPNDPFFISTYAYALLLQNKNDEALRLVSKLKPEFLKIPSIAAYYGIVEAQTGHKDAARAPLQLAGTAQLLPEEKEIVRLASAHL
ncbi:MAG TPA: hypothetical protein VNZ64_09785 [Candidatus Acidoferrum sp.]|nr:hypothetical protein [Candidatus Acidoferrum sp.]